MITLEKKLTAEGLAALVEREIKRLACVLRSDVLDALEHAMVGETFARGRLALEQLVANASITDELQVPLCQDTGSVWVLLEVGEKDSLGNDISIPANIFSLLDDAVARAYTQARLRKSIVCDALVDRQNTNNNTPCFAEVYFNHNTVGATLHIMLKGGGSDNASRVAMLAPGAGIEGVKRLVIDAVREKAASACPPIVVGVAVGSTFDKVGGLSKRALLRQVGLNNPDPQIAQLERELLAKINALGIGPGGFGGATTALAVNIETAPSHIASMPVAVNIGCNSLRSCSIDLEDESETMDSRLRGNDRGGITITGGGGGITGDSIINDQQIHLHLPADVNQLKQLKAGDEVLLSGTIYTLRDVGHKRVLDHLNKTGELPYNLKGQALFYAGPTPQKENRPFGAIGPTTASRMDFAAPQLIEAGINVMLAKGDRSSEVVKACRTHNSVYLATTGGAAALLAEYVKAAKMIAYEDLGTEALQELTIENMPAFVAIDTNGANLYTELLNEQ